MRKSAAITTGLLALFILISNPVNAEECLKIASDPHSVRASKLFGPSVKKVFKNAGICADFINIPIRRIQKSMVNGSIDGEFFRVNNYIKAMSDYVLPVPTPATKAYGLIITRADSDFKPAGLKDIGERKIGILHGYKWHEIMSQKFRKTAKSNKYLFLVKMLQARRIDGILIEDFTVDRLIDAGVLKNEKIYKSPSLIDLSVYILLAKKHKNLLSTLDNSIKKVIAEGGFSVP